MFELGRELKRLLGTDRGSALQDGLTGGDPALLELLDYKLLLEEARSADAASGRTGARDKPARRLEAAVVWREAARRSGDAALLRKAASAAEMAAEGYDPTRRSDGWARARTEQAYCALLGAELFGDEGLNAAAEVAFRDARTAARAGVAAAMADVGLAIVQGRQHLAAGDAAQARICADAFAMPAAALDAIARRNTAARPLAAEARIARADLLCGWGARLKDESLVRMALDDAAGAARRLNLAYEPISWARAEMIRGEALTLWGELTGDIDAIAAAAAALAGALEAITRDHSPLDWARIQVSLGQALRALGEASGEERAFEQAVTCFDRAALILKEAPTSPLRGVAAGARAMCLARSAELTGDLAVLDAAEAAMKIELSKLQARRDPVGWALAQTHLARLYEARIDITGHDRGERAAAVTALDAALDVFAEQGLHSMSVIASDALGRLRAGSSNQPRTAV
ncbi:hypothetical protein [Phenylobacterium deserti]|uniref:MalT-like TPR region domain-containing protein n=1 Tax=Phenylobacterium deserti TaxID=1914756 RepID=A0A328AS89_9CAUL|nr:hypothetical protein [Phenylobacterium deserti]RAK57932.1 hypothetical protein DJ018_08500 [Phenylobacterium deserti]